jgi:hypothetical protein
LQRETAATVWASINAGIAWTAAQKALLAFSVVGGKARIDIPRAVD